MALLFYDGFDTYSADALDYLKAGYTVHTTGATFTVINNAGNTRHGYGQYLENYIAAFGTSVGKLFLPSFGEKTEIIFGFALNVQGRNNPSAPTAFLKFYSRSEVQCSLYMEETSVLTLWNGDRASLLGTTSKNIPSKTWCFVEIRLKIHDSTGTCEIRLDGASIYNGINLDTKASTTATGINSICFSMQTSGFTGSVLSWIDDIYICDTTGGIHDDFLGDCMSLTRLVNGDTARADFTCSSGSDHYALVDDSVHDDESTYVESVTDGQYDILEVEDLPANTTEVLAVAVETWCKLEEAGDTFVINMLNSGGTEYDASDGGLGVQPIYLPRKSIWEKDPNTNAAWVVANANAIKIGYKIDVK